VLVATVHVQSREVLILTVPVPPAALNDTGALLALI
jgi:hypothetical protein